MGQEGKRERVDANAIKWLSIRIEKGTYRVEKGRNTAGNEG